MANAVYNSFKKEIMDGTIDLDTNTFFVMLVTTAYSTIVDIDANTRRSNIVGEVTGTGYTAGGAEITSKTMSQDNTGDAGVWDGADVTWATSTITARGAVVYKSLGTGSANDSLVCFVDFGADKSSSAGNFTIQWSTAGILTLS